MVVQDAPPCSAVAWVGHSGRWVSVILAAVLVLSACTAAGSPLDAPVDATEGASSGGATGGVGGAYVAIGDAFYLLICEPIAYHGLELGDQMEVSTWSIGAREQRPDVAALQGKDPADYVGIGLDPVDDCFRSEPGAGGTVWYLGVRSDESGVLVPLDPSVPSADGPVSSTAGTVASGSLYLRSVSCLPGEGVAVESYTLAADIPGASTPEGAAQSAMRHGFREPAYSEASSDAVTFWWTGEAGNVVAIGDVLALPAGGWALVELTFCD